MGLKPAGPGQYEPHFFVTMIYVSATDHVTVAPAIQVHQKPLEYGGKVIKIKTVKCWKHTRSRVMSLENKGKKIVTKICLTGKLFEQINNEASLIFYCLK